MNRKPDAGRLLQKLANSVRDTSIPEVSALFSSGVMDEIRLTASRCIEVHPEYASIGRLVWLSASGAMVAALLLMAVVSTGFGIDIELIAFDSIEALPFAL